jgi:hypothetical protein
MRLEMMYVVISRNHNTRVHFFTDNGWSWSVPSHFRAIEWRHHLDASGECQPDSVASLMRTNTCLTVKLWSAVMVNIAMVKGTFLLGYSKVY